MTKYNYGYVHKSDERDCLKKLEKRYKREEKLRVECIENGIILPRKDTSGTEQSNVWMGIGGVLDSEGNFVELSGISGFAENEGGMAFGGKYAYTAIETFLDEEIIYMGAFQPHWGHFMLEYCTRLWYYVQLHRELRIAYCGFNCEPDSISGNFLDFLRLLGIRKEQLIDIRNVTKIRKIIIPEQSFLRDRYYTDDYQRLIDFAYQNITKIDRIPYEKIYFTRTDFANRKERGEKEIKDIFEANGYVCLAPEKLSVEEQMYYVRNCKEFVVIPGGSSMNGVFANNGTRRIYLKKAYLPELPGDIFQIDQMTNASQVTFVDCYFKPYKNLPIGYGGGPHLIGVTRQFRLFLKDNNMVRMNYGKCYLALYKNWLWLSGIELYYVKKSWKDFITFNRIKYKIERLSAHKIDKIIIYPYGNWGNMAKSILEKRKNIKYIIVDHYKCFVDKNIYDIDIFNNEQFLDYKILICSDKKSKHHESIKETVFREVSDRKRVISIF